MVMPTNGWDAVTLPATNGAAFFRLRYPGSPGTISFSYQEGTFRLATPWKSDCLCVL